VSSRDPGVLFCSRYCGCFPDAAALHRQRATCQPNPLPTPPPQPPIPVTLCNPPVSQAAQRPDEPLYAALVASAVASAAGGYAASSPALPPPVAPHKPGTPPSPASIDLAIDYLSVGLGKQILEVVRGYVSTEVDIRLSFDAAGSEARARRIIAMYEAAGVPRGRVLIKLAGTWEGVRAAEALERDGIRTNITLVFGFCQAVAAAQAKATLISPFPGRGGFLWGGL
jgi:hypothetical protein